MAETCPKCQSVTDGSQGPALYRMDNVGLWCEHNEEVRDAGSWWVRQEEYEAEVTGLGAQLATKEAALATAEAEIVRLHLVEGTLAKVNAALEPYLLEHADEPVSTTSAVPHMLAEIVRLGAELDSLKRGVRQWRDDYRRGAAAVKAGLEELSRGWSNAAVLAALFQPAPEPVREALRIASELRGPDADATPSTGPKEKT